MQEPSQTGRAPSIISARAGFRDRSAVPLNLIPAMRVHAGECISASDVVHVVPDMNGHHWLYLKEGSVVLFAPTTGTIIQGTALPVPAEIEEAVTRGR